MGKHYFQQRRSAGMRQQMPTDSPPPHSRKSPTISPAQAIADAWEKESMESQDKWRRLDVKIRFNAPRKPDRNAKM